MDLIKKATTIVSFKPLQRRRAMSC
ncbi:unnamed protein product [Cyprideis torosa]|uniref:Uncharacterized protein n=1 Tax=Cyprideis torosa TaxID=163714 RepID=A0A7R8WLG6_9CRUS|nr:unnamed protein product [Cyprideis torosa]CAG0904304.1 unnamed protein product [Cyprideis torosa]